MINKVQVVARCLKRVEEEFAGNPRNLENITKLDAIVLNLQRACEAAIDLAMHMVATERWGTLKRAGKRLTCWSNTVSFRPP